MTDILKFIGEAILAALFAWAWIYLGNETARRNKAIYPKYPDGTGDPHL